MIHMVCHFGAYWIDPFPSPMSVPAIKVSESKGSVTLDVYYLTKRIGWWADADLDI